MIKLEAYIEVTNSEIYEVELTVELTEKEYVALKKMSNEEYIKFMRERMIHRISDYDLKFEVPDLDEFYESEDK